MDNKDFSNLGNHIKSTVEDVLNSLNLNQIKDNIEYKAENTMNDMLKNIKINENTFYHKNEGISKSSTNSLIPKRPHGSISGILFMVFGFTGTGLFTVLLLLYSILNTFLGKYSLYSNVGVGILISLLSISLFVGVKGLKLRKRVTRFKVYTKQFKGQSYCSIKDLSISIGESNKYVIKDLKKMIKLKMFPQGHIDDAQTCLMISNEIYEQYLKTQEGLKLREKEEQRIKDEEASITDPLIKELRQTIKEGNHYISQIKSANDAIPGEDISNKLYRLEDITRKIFHYIENHPEKLSEIHKFMNYYLPTTLKLVNSYKELDFQPIQGENIMNTKEEIKNSLDTINKAFENLLDDLFKDIAFDISTDISALETMLAQEGLTESDFKK